MSIKSENKTFAVGATLSTKMEYRYLGDGDGYEYLTATFLTEKGELSTVACASAEVDASVEVKAAAAVAKTAAEALLSAKNAVKRVAEFAKAAKEVEKGRTVRIFKKRAKNFGKEGRAFWIGESTWGTRVGFETAEGETVWTALSNLEVTGGNEAALAEVASLENEAEIKAVAAASAAALAARAAKEALAETSFRLAVVASAA